MSKQNVPKQLRDLYCKRCFRPISEADDWQLWNGDYDKGRLKGVICPNCQTVEEWTEAETNEATIDYSKVKDVPKKHLFACPDCTTKMFGTSPDNFVVLDYNEDTGYYTCSSCGKSTKTPEDDGFFPLGRIL